MRLLQLDDTRSGFSLVEYLGQDVPPYAILSHTWGSSHEEVTYQDMLNGTASAKIGYNKLTFCADQAANDNLCHFWIDTCCINKDSSAELSEAITSMFRWYNNSAVCYAYLSDVKVEHARSGHDVYVAFRSSRWFSRGWTLQELLASPTVMFFSYEREYLGDKVSLERHIHDITHIPKVILRGGSLANFDHEERISWITGRQTTREEDLAYSLLGILNLSMLPNYGEGKEMAFRRLRRELREISDGWSRRLRSSERTVLLRSLFFDQLEMRQMAIKNAHASTCTWLLQNPVYISWCDKNRMKEHHGFLWIKGKPGTGKSTLMKFAVAQAYKTPAKRAITSFFFNARGECLEKSPVGTYRTLLYQLFDRFPTLDSALDCLNAPRSSISIAYNWGIEPLKTVLETVILLLKNHSVVCYIDALDECEEEEVRDMVRFFQHIGERAVTAGIDFRVCFASRHYPHIPIRNGVGLVLEGQEGHSQDVTDYLKSELAIGETELAGRIRYEVQKKASGVFMWVVLVVKILNKEYDRGRMHALRRKLQEIPSDLYELIRSILMRDAENVDELTICIQWVLFAKRPLSAKELYFAILAGVESDALSAWNKEDITEDVIERFIVDSSRGLVEIATGKNQKRRKVQFIHQSVRDLVLKDGGPGQMRTNGQSNFAGQSHDRLKWCCLEYLTMDAITPWIMASAHPAQVVKTRRRLTMKKFPFLKYAVQAVLHHAEAAESAGIAQDGFLKSFPHARWIKLNNLTKRFEEYTAHVSLEYVLAERNLSNLLRLQAPSINCLRVEQELCGCPLFAAATCGGREAVHSILEGFLADCSSSNFSTSSHSIHHYCDRLLKGLASGFEYLSRRGMISYSAEFGLTPVVSYLFKNTKDESAFTGVYKHRTPLWWASSAGHEDTVELLLNMHIFEIDGKDEDGETPLYAAAAGGHSSVVRLLLNRGAEVNIKGGAHDFALLTALSRCSSDHEEVVKTLLDVDTIDVNVRATNGMTPLLCATHNGLESLVALLLDKGADVDARYSSGASPLTEAICDSYDGVARILLDKGIDVNAQGGHYCNALQAAALCGSDWLVELLLDRGAEVNAQGGHYGTAIQAAASRYTPDSAASEHKTQVVQLLIERGADPNAQSGYYGTALQAAAATGSTAVVELLLGKGVDVNFHGGRHGTALQAAWKGGHEDTAKALAVCYPDVQLENPLVTITQVCAGVSRKM